MSESFPETLRDWVTRERAQFAHPPVRWRGLRNGYEFQFQGITSALQGQALEDGQLMLIASYKGQCWDILQEFDVYAQRSASGHYFCKLCVPPEVRWCYSSRELLWIAHSFKPLAVWLHENMIASNRLELYSYKGATEAKIIHLDPLGVVRGKRCIASLRLLNAD